jgi:hypothetical protein
MAYKEARVAISHQAGIEKAVVTTASVLWTNVEDGKKRVAAFAPLIDARANSLLNEVKAAYQMQALQRGVPAVELVASAEEKAASLTIVEVVPTPAAPGGGAPSGRAAGGGPGGFAAGAPAAATLPDEFNAEFNALLAKKMTVLQIRDFLSGEFTPLPLADVMAVLKAREAAGRIKLVPR